MTNDPLDPLIDDVARRMTSAPARPGLANRVAARIADGAAPREGRSWRQWVLVPASAACVLALAVVILRERTLGPDPVRLKPDATVVASRAATDPRPADATPPPQTVRLKPDTTYETPIARTALPRPALPPESTIAPMAVVPIVEGVQRIEIDPIAIERIEISAMP